MREKETRNKDKVEQAQLLKVLRNIATPQHRKKNGQNLFLACLCVKHTFKNFTLLSHLIFSTALGCSSLIFLFYRWGNGGTESWLVQGHTVNKRARLLTIIMRRTLQSYWCPLCTQKCCNELFWDFRLPMWSPSLYLMCSSLKYVSFFKKEEKY